MKFHCSPMGLLMIFGTKDYYFTTHATKGVLTGNVCFLLSQIKEAWNFLCMVFKPVELNLVDRFLIYAMVHKLSSVEHDTWIFLV